VVCFDDPLEYLPGDLRRIAEVIGLKGAVRIALAFRGSRLYVPALDDLQRRVRDQCIREDSDRGISARKLSIRYGVSVRTIWAILGRPSEQIHPILSELLAEQSDTDGTGA
jgi:Mor family transcriptional regulator